MLLITYVIVITLTKGNILSIKFVMLGFLNESPMTGYDLKKRFSDLDLFYWSGNSNQIYRKLVDLHEEGQVTVEVQQQESKPPRKIYTITEAGKTALREWLLGTPEIPQFRNALLMQLTWADQVDPAALEAMLAAYEDNLQAYLLMLGEQVRRYSDQQKAETSVPLWNRIADHWLSFYQLELDWVHALRDELTRKAKR